jgi:hypothetical protein
VAGNVERFEKVNKKFTVEKEVVKRRGEALPKTS